MQPTAAKAQVRSFFYQRFLPGQLSMQLLRGGSYLVLLGEGQEEESLLKSLGVPGHRIYSVERDPEVFRLQSQRASQGKLSVVLYYGELIEFITHYLQTNQRFLVLNLDICGAYKTRIDPVMTPILLFARRNPKTVIATYSNAGRDRPQLLEGLKSLAICYWLSPDATVRAVNELYGRYRAAGLRQNVSFNMVLRHLFWLRSHLEHVLFGGVAMSKARAESAERLMSALDHCWQQAAVAVPLKYGALLSAVQAIRAHAPRARLLDLGIQSVTVATYESFNHFYHMGWFASYQRVSPQAAAEWLMHALEVLVAQPLRFACQDDDVLGSYVSSGESVPHDLEIWTGDGLDNPGRKLRIPLPSPQLTALGRLIDSEPVHDQTEAVEAAKSNGSVPKQLSEQQIKRIRARARGLPDASTDQIVRSLRLQNYPKGSITAHIAVARRKSRSPA